MALTDKQIGLLGELLSAQEKDPDGADALRFQLRHEDDVNEIDRLVGLQLVERTDKNRFVVPMRTVVQMAGRNDVADDVLATCAQIYDVLRRIFKEDPERNVLVKDLPNETKLPDAKLRWALQFLLNAPIWSSRSTSLSVPDAHVRLSESVIRWKTFGDVVNIFHQWRKSNPNVFNTYLQREKQQKFGILDAPGLLAQDLEMEPGRLGRALLYIDLDDFKPINTALTETIVDREVLPVIHQNLAQVVENLGFAYAEGGDEFTVLLTNTSPGMAREFADSVRQLLAALTFDGKAKGIRITASIGLAHETTSDKSSSLKERANLAKHKAKESGKNRIEVHLDEL